MTPSPAAPAPRTGPGPCSSAAQAPTPSSAHRSPHRPPPPLPPHPSPVHPPCFPGAWATAASETSHMSVKRPAVGQVENSEGTIWGQVGDLD